MKDENSNKSLQILLVEDSPSDAALLQESILSIGVRDISISVVQSLSEAKDHLKNNHTDAMLLDLTLPDSSGLDTFRQARMFCPDLPVVVLTGVDDESIGVEAVRMGVQDYLVKGRADSQTVTRAIRYSIERKKAEDAIRQSNEELNRFNRAAVGRELRIIELKKEVNDFCDLTGQPRRYPLDFEKENDNGKNEI